MATTQKKRADGSMVGRLAERGEEAVNRLLDELGKNPMLADALHRAASAKGKLDSASHAALVQVGIAPVDEVKELRKRVEALEKRLAKLEGGKAPTAKRSETKATPTAAKATRTSVGEEKVPSPETGRALGGGTARGGSAG